MALNRRAIYLNIMSCYYNCDFSNPFQINQRIYCYLFTRYHAFVCLLTWLLAFCCFFYSLSSYVFSFVIIISNGNSNLIRSSDYQCWITQNDIVLLFPPVPIRFPKDNGFHLFLYPGFSSCNIPVSCCWVMCFLFSNMNRKVEGFSTSFWTPPIVPPLLCAFSVSFIPAVVQLAWLLSLLAVPAPCTDVELLLWGAAKRLAASQTA